MALRWLEGFETIGTTPGNTSVRALVTNTASGSSGDGSFTIKAGRLAVDSSVQFGGFAVLNTPVFSAVDTWVVGFGYKQDAYTNKQEIFAFRDGTNEQASASPSSPMANSRCGEGP